MDTSVGAVNNAILDMLCKAGQIGVHIDDITKVLGFEAKRQILPRLYNLQGRGLIERLDGQKWRTVSYEQDIASSTSTPPAPFTSKPEKVEACSSKQGGKNFVSYKNIMQEYCQKKYLPMPTYRSEKTDFGYLGIVSFGSELMKSQIAMPSLKEAEQMVAFEALKNALVLPSTAVFNESTQLNLPSKKRKSGVLTEPTEPASKIQNTILQEVTSMRNKLQEIAQKNALPIPNYEVTTNAMGFMATVEFQGRKFKSIQAFNKKKAAEQSAAHVALYELGIIKVPPGGLSNDGKHEAHITTATAVTTPVSSSSDRKGDPNDNFKSKLQDYILKRKYALPTYKVLEEPLTPNGGFIASVLVEGREYKGELKRNKKEAEKDSARVALVALTAGEQGS